MNNTKYRLYALLLSDNVIYIGVTTNIKNRIITHKRTKHFDSHLVIKTYLNRKDAYIAENAIIRYLGIFGDINIINALHQNDVHKRLYVRDY